MNDLDIPRVTDAARVVAPKERTSVLDSVELHFVETIDEANAFLHWLGERRPILGLDIETSGLSLARDRVRLVQFGDGREGWAIPYEEWRGVVRQALTTYNRPIALQHAKFDAKFLMHDGLQFPWEHVHDTLPMSFLVDSLGPKSLKPAAALYVDPVARAGESELKRAMAANRWDYGTIPVDLPAYWGYSAADTVLTALLAERLWPRVQPYRDAYDLELACERVLCGMELRGIMIDVPYVEEAAARLVDDLHALVDDLTFNPHSSAEVAVALQAEGVQLTKRTPSGTYALDEEVLSDIDHPIAETVLAIRTKSKLLGSYFENFLEYHSEGVLYPSIHQLQARTGRMSVTEPALQTLPRNSHVRDSFVPRPGNRMVLADYDSEELRILASLSGDEAMIRAFEEDRDLHAETARRVFGDKAGKAERNVGKSGMYAKVYGSGISTFSNTVKLPAHDAGRIFAAISDAYPGIDEFMAKVTAAVRQRAKADGSEYGYVVLSDGRRLRVPAHKAYAGANYRIQGEGAVVMKRAIVNADAAGLGDFLLLTVHDELLFDVPEDDVQDALPVIEKSMRRDDFRVPLTVGTKVVDRWGDNYREDG